MNTDAPVAVNQPTQNQGWLKVDESKPEVGQIIIVPRSGGIPFCGAYSPLGDLNRCLDRQLGKWWEFTFWMPAPALPENV